jgi:hypothetical protein
MRLTEALNPPPLKDDGTPLYTFATNRLTTQILEAETVTVEIIGHCTPDNRQFRQIVGNMSTANNWNATTPTANDIFSALNREVGLAGTANNGTTNAFIIQHREGSVTDANPSVVKIASIKISIK